jgi:hypothetical protein
VRWHRYKGPNQRIGDFAEETLDPTTAATRTLWVKQTMVATRSAMAISRRIRKGNAALCNVKAANYTDYWLISDLELVKGPPIL